jgi:hypothetical protein
MLLFRKLEAVIAMRLTEQDHTFSNRSHSRSHSQSMRNSHQAADEALQRALDFARFHQSRQTEAGDGESAWQSEGFRALLALLDE